MNNLQKLLFEVKNMNPQTAPNHLKPILIKTIEYCEKNNCLVKFDIIFSLLFQKQLKKLEKKV